jgi:hypothetical protein
MPESARCRFGDSGFSLPRPFGLHPIHQVGELRLREHLRRWSVVDNQRASFPAPSAIRPIPAATTASDETTGHSTWPAKDASQVAGYADLSLRVPTSPFQAQGEISPGKNAPLHGTTAGSTPPRLDHESFAVYGPFALLGNVFYPVLVHRLAASLHASSPHSVTLMPLRFASFAVINSRWDLRPQECAHAGRAIKKPRLHNKGGV